MSRRKSCALHRELGLPDDDDPEFCLSKVLSETRNAERAGYDPNRDDNDLPLSFFCDDASWAWPGLMCEAVAAYYLAQISIPLFRREVAAGRMPKPVGLIAKRKVWLKEHLDGWRLRDWRQAWQDPPAPSPALTLPITRAMIRSR